MKGNHLYRREEAKFTIWHACILGLTARVATCADLGSQNAISHLFSAGRHAISTCIRLSGSDTIKAEYCAELYDCTDKALQAGKTISGGRHAQGVLKSLSELDHL